VPINATLAVPRSAHGTWRGGLTRVPATRPPAACAFPAGTTSPMTQGRAGETCVCEIRCRP